MWIFFILLFESEGHHYLKFICLTLICILVFMPQALAVVGPVEGVVWSVCQVETRETVRERRRLLQRRRSQNQTD